MQLLTETDNPGGPEWLSGTVEMPSVVRDVIGEVAPLRDVDEFALTDTVFENFVRLIGDHPNFARWLPQLRG